MGALLEKVPQKNLRPMIRYGGRLLKTLPLGNMEKLEDAMVVTTRLLRSHFKKQKNNRSSSLDKNFWAT